MVEDVVPLNVASQSPINVTNHVNRKKLALQWRFDKRTALRTPVEVVAIAPLTRTAAGPGGSMPADAMRLRAITMPFKRTHVGVPQC